MVRTDAGAQEFLTDAILGGATVALLASTCSAPSERIVDAALTALGPELSDNVRIFQCPQSSTSITDAGQSGEEDPPSFEQSLQKATAKVDGLQSRHSLQWHFCITFFASMQAVRLDVSALLGSLATLFLI